MKSLLLLLCILVSTITNFGQGVVVVGPAAVSAGASTKSSTAAQTSPALAATSVPINVTTVMAGTTVVNNLPLNVLSYGATGGNSTLDTTGLTNAIAAACATAHGNGGVAEVDVPVTPSAYVISSPIALCSNLRIHGVGGYPTIDAPGGLFTVTGQIHGEVDHLDIEGGGGTSTYAIQHLPSGTSDLLWRYHDNLIYGFGNGTAGGCFNIASDSIRLSITDNHLGCDTAGIKKSGPADTMEIANNLIGSATTTSGGWCIDASASGGGLASDAGAGTQRIIHNNMQCAVQGAIRINSQSNWLVESNEWEYEGGGPLTNAQGAAYDFIAAGAIKAERNESNSHVKAAYDYYVGNSVGSSEFANNTSDGAVTAYSFFVGTGVYNTYVNNLGASGPGSEYSSAYIGIEGGSQNSAGRFFGCQTSTFGALEFCPNVQFDGTISVLAQGSASSGLATTNLTDVSTTELSWTPVLTGFTTGGSGTFAAVGHYRKVGHIISWNLLITGTGTASISAAGGGASFISGFPFTPAEVTTGAYASEAFTMTGVGFLNASPTLFYTQAFSAVTLPSNSIAISGEYYY